jgi:predicted esterase
MRIGLLTGFVLPLARATRLTSRIVHYSSRMPRTTYDSDGITVHPDDGNHSATVVLMHGLGDSADGWIDAAQDFGRRMPWVKWILPTAQQMPVTLNMGHRMNAWYDIVGLDERAGESCEGIDKSVERVKGILEAEAALGLPYNRMALAGFSQGGAMSLFTGMQMPAEKRLAGLLIMSGYCPGYSKFKLTAELADLPVLHCHGTADAVVQFAWAKQTRDYVVGQGATRYELKEYAGMGHTASPAEIRDATAHLLSILPEDKSLCLAPKDPSTMSVKELKAAIVQAGIGSKAVGFSEKHEFVSLLVAHREGKL